MEIDAVEESVLKFARFSKMVQFKAFQPFTSAENALDNMTSISEGEYFCFLSFFSVDSRCLLGMRVHCADGRMPSRIAKHRGLILV